MAHADLARYAGQFVWLELNFDTAKNRAFLDKYGAVGTPTFYIIDPQDAKVVATESGAMSYAEFVSFLDRGAHMVLSRAQAPADLALARGDALLARRPLEAAAAYRDALRLSPPGWPKREIAEASIVSALQSGNQARICAEMAAKETSHMMRGPVFARTVISGMWCLVSSDNKQWIKKQAQTLRPLAEEALSLRTTERDHRDELYRTLMILALSEDDRVTTAQWGDRWLTELDAIRPTSDEERMAVDIARVESIDVFGDPKRILPALLDSELAMPYSWNASLRVAQMENKARDSDATIAACNRGLARSPGPLGKSWLLQIKADALRTTGQPAEAERALEAAEQAALAIPLRRTRDNNLRQIRQALGSLSDKKDK